MSEYWVSKKRYFCKYCDIYIADDVPSRQQHENGLRHKGNVERFIRGLYKGSEKRKKDLDEEKRDMARVELAAQAAYAEDVASGRAKTMTAPLASTSSTPRKPVPKPSNPYANYSTAASLGYTDPDAERLAAEVEYRRTQGVAGDWEVVTSSPATPVETVASSAVDTLKRSAEMAVDEEDVREFKLRKKTLKVGLDEIYDPGLVPIKLKKEPTPPPEASTVPLEQPSVRSETRKWTSVRWRRAGEVVKEEEDSALAERSDSAPNVEDAAVKKENEPVVQKEELIVKEGLATMMEIPSWSGDNALSSSADNLKPKPEEMEVLALSTTDSSGSLFRKRKSRPNGMKGKA